MLEREGGREGERGRREVERGRGRREGEEREYREMRGVGVERSLDVLPCPSVERVVDEGGVSECHSSCDQTYIQ